MNIGDLGTLKEVFIYVVPNDSDVRRLALV